MTLKKEILRHVLLAGLFISCPYIVMAQDLSAVFIGNEAVKITDGNITLLSDFPYQSGYSGYMEYDVSSVKPSGKVLSLITHKHADHFEKALFKKTDWYIVAPNEIEIEIPRERRIEIRNVIKFENIHIEAFRTPHAGIEHYSYKVTWNSHSFYFPGDTESVETLKHAQNVNILFITPWLLNEAKRRGMSFSADKIIVYHHTKDQKINCAGCVVPQQGEVLKLYK